MQFEFPILDVGFFDRRTMDAAPYSIADQSMRSVRDRASHQLRAVVGQSNVVAALRHGIHVVRAPRGSAELEAGREHTRQPTPTVYVRDD